MANGVLGGWGVGVVRTGIGGVRAVGSAVGREVSEGGGRVKGVITDLHA